MEVSILGKDAQGYNVALPSQLGNDKGAVKLEPVGAPVAPGPLLTNLTTGMQLQGVVDSCATYAAWLNVGIYRVGKGGRFVPVNAMLHKSDIELKLLKELQNYRSTNFHNLLEKGTKVTVYVKEVSKQSG